MSFLQRLFGPPNVRKLKAERDVKGLIKALRYKKDAKVRQAAAKALVKITATRARSHKRDAKAQQAATEELVEIGAAAVAALRDRKKEVRQAAAKLLIGLYRSGKLNDAHKRSILAQRDRIMQPHHDGRYHRDHGEKCGVKHIDAQLHNDTGIGVDFPI